MISKFRDSRSEHGNSGVHIKRQHHLQELYIENYVSRDPMSF